MISLRYKIGLALLFFFLHALVCVHTISAQDNITVVPVGKGSYGNGTPFDLALDTWGSDNNWRVYDQFKALHDQWPEKWHLALPDTNTRSIPTNNYWTSLVFQENGNWGGMNWFYPGVARFQPEGTEVWFPRQWNGDGTALDQGWSIVVEPEELRAFQPEKCTVVDWDDWRFVTAMTNAQDTMVTTVVQGAPYLWMEPTFNPTIKLHDGPYSTNGTTEIQNWPHTGNSMVGTTSGNYFAVFLPDNTVIQKDGNRFTFEFAGADQFIVIGFLNDPSEFDQLQAYAYNKPVETKVHWGYDPANASLNVDWQVAGENLKDGSPGQVLQGFLPHQYQAALALPDFEAITYQTPKGLARYAVGNAFNFQYRFNGIIPHINAPELDFDHLPFDSLFLADRITEASTRSALGEDIYWGMKPLFRQAKYYAMAEETNHPAADKLRDICFDALNDWLTYEPGETVRAFYRYDDDSNLDALVGFDPGGYSATFTDHDMCYGYLLYAAVLYGMYNPEFLEDYGEMLTLLVKQINNWDTGDQDYPYFRLFEPWTGHNWAGGVSSPNGNNVESLSEGMQFWASMFLLGEMLGDDGMRDAAAFGYSASSRSFDQYYRDADEINFSPDYPADVAAMIWSSGPATGNYVGNEWNYAMNWIPYSPAMNYMYSDAEEAQAQYQSFDALYANREGMWGGDFWNNLNMYIQGFDHPLALQQYEDHKTEMLGHDLSGITYYYLYGNRDLGYVDWSVHCDAPMSQGFYDAQTDEYAYVCYNPSDEEITVNVYHGQEWVGEFKVPPYQLITSRLDQQLSGIQISTDKDVLLAHETTQLEVIGVDQHGASLDLWDPVQWHVLDGVGQVDQEGVFTAGNENATTSTVVATSGEFSDTILIITGEPRKVASISITPGYQVITPEQIIYYSATATDQYGQEMAVEFTWDADPGGQINVSGLFQTEGTPGYYSVYASAEGVVAEALVLVKLPLTLPNIALNRPASANSTNGGNTAERGNDDSEGSFWQSVDVATDDGVINPYWWMVELDTVYEVHDIEIVWDVSASNYTIESSLDGENWETHKTVLGTGWWTTDELNFSNDLIVARYLRVHCYDHDGDWGYAIKEFRAFGQKAVGAGQLAVLQMTPSNGGNLTQFDALQFAVTGYDEEGKAVEMTGEWSLQGQGQLDQSGLYTGTTVGGPFTVVYEQDGLQTSAEVTVVEPLVLHIDQLIELASGDEMGKVFNMAGQVVMQQYNQEAMRNLSGGWYLIERGVGKQLVWVR